MTRRFWRFSLLVLLGTAAVAAVLAITFRAVAEQNLKEMRAEQNIELARSLSNALIDDVILLNNIAATSSWTQLQRSPEIGELAERIRRKIENLTVFRVNIFALDIAQAHVKAENSMQIRACIFGQADVDETA